MSKRIEDCQDCGLPLKGKSCETGMASTSYFPKGSIELQFGGWTEEKDHFMVCCDCFDERQGMPASKRSVPRPK